jgi:hypothetical protein
LISNEKNSFLETLQRYKAFFNSFKETFLIVKQNDRWNLLCGKIELSSSDKPLSEKEIYTLDDRLLVIQKVERFDIGVLTNIIHAFTHSVMDKDIDLSNLQSFTLEIFDKMELLNLFMIISK